MPNRKKVSYVNSFTPEIARYPECCMRTVCSRISDCEGGIRHFRISFLFSRISSALNLLDGPLSREITSVKDGFVLYREVLLLHRKLHASPANFSKSVLDFQYSLLQLCSKYGLENLAKTPATSPLAR